MNSYEPSNYATGTSNSLPLLLEIIYDELQYHAPSVLTYVCKKSSSFGFSLPTWFLHFFLLQCRNASNVQLQVNTRSLTNKQGKGSYWRHQSRNARISHELHRSGQGLIVWKKFLYRRGSRSTSLVKWRGGKASSFWLSEPTSLRAQMLVSSPGTGNLGFIGNVLYYIELAGGTSSVAIPDSVLSLLPWRPNSLAIALKFLSWARTNGWVYVQLEKWIGPSQIYLSTILFSKRPLLQLLFSWPRKLFF